MLTQHQKSRSNQPAASPVDAFVQGSLPQKAVAKLCRVSTVIHSSISLLILSIFPKYCDINRRTTTAGGSLSPYCSTECAELAKTRTPARDHPRYSVNVQALLDQCMLRPKCALPGCLLSPENNKAGGYCSKGHRE